MNDEHAFAERVHALTVERDEAIADRESFRKLEAESYRKAESLRASCDALKARVTVLEEALEICRETESDF